MRTKNTILFSLISTFFLIFLISIWKILATLQGLSINSFNIEIIFIFGLLISLAHLGIGDRIKSIYKSIIFSGSMVFFLDFDIDSDDPTLILLNLSVFK